MRKTNTRARLRLDYSILLRNGKNNANKVNMINRFGLINCRGVKRPYPFIYTRERSIPVTSRLPNKSGGVCVAPGF